MAFAVVLYLDQASTEAIEATQRTIVEAGLSPGTSVLEFHPHISLAICERMDIEAFRPYLEQFATSTGPINIRFPRLGTFPTDPAVLFLDPAVSPALVAAHERLHERYLEFGEEPWEYYLPDQWVPHCTLVDKLRDGDVVKAVGLCAGLRLPLRARLEEVALVEFYPPRLHYAFRLGVSRNP